MKPLTIFCVSLAAVIVAGCASSPRSYTLEARDAITHGEKLRYEPEPHKNTLGYWVNPADWAHWTVDIREKGMYEVHLLQGCGAGQGGSDVHLLIGDQALAFQVEDTGHFQNFRWKKAGVVTLDHPGEYPLEVRPVKLANRAVMDLRRVQLISVNP